MKGDNMSLVSIKLPVKSNAVCVKVPDMMFESNDMVEFTLLLTLTDLPMGKSYCCVTLLDDDGNKIDEVDANREDLSIDFEFSLTAETEYGLYKFDVDVVDKRWYINIS